MLPLRIRKSFPGVKSAQKFSGMQLTDEVHWRYVYDRDGTLRSYSMGTKKVGKWTIEKDELCLYFKEPDDGCYEVSRAGDHLEIKPSRFGLTIQGILQPPTHLNYSGLSISTHALYYR